MKKLILALFLVMACVPAWAAGRTTVTNITLTSAGTEYSWTVPSKCTAFTIQSRTAADFKLSAVSGESGSTYFTVKSGTAYYETNVDSWSNKYYMQSANAGQVIEIVYWVNN